ncbi:MAG: hypothetical protein KC591_17740, partial [Gemmatimonadetes bacterium]|nr:hypothetical protein [Gemmatimonadota bacterium]
ETGTVGGIATGAATATEAAVTTEAAIATAIGTATAVVVATVRERERPKTTSPGPRPPLRSASRREPFAAS